MNNNIDVSEAIANVTEDTVVNNHSGLKKGLVSGGIAVGAILLYEGGKWAFKKIKKALGKKKDKKKAKEETIELNSMEVEDLPDIE